MTRRTGVGMIRADDIALVAEPIRTARNLANADREARGELDEATALDLHRIALLAEGELLLGEVADQVLKDLALEGEPSAALDGRRAAGHDGHIEIGGDHAQAVVGRLRQNARKDRYRRPVLNHTLQDGKLLKNKTSLQFQFHQPSFQKRRQRRL